MKKKVTKAPVAKSGKAKEAMVDPLFFERIRKEMGPNAVTEMMTRVEFNRGTKLHRVLRVWSIAKEGDCGPDQRVLDVLGQQRNPNNIVEHVSQMMGKLGPEVVAAYELLSPAGHGFVHYPDWK